MASDRKTLERAILKHARLKAKGRFSAPPDAGGGRVAILVGPPYSEEDDLEFWIEEATTILDERRRLGQPGFIDVRATKETVLGAVASSSVSDIVCIGHGTFHTFATDKRVDEESGDCSWRDVARAVTHLKTGQFIQRTCARVHNVTSASLGTFAMADQRKVFAPAGHFFLPEIEGQDAELLLHPVYLNAVNTFDGFIARARFLKECQPIVSDEEGAN